MYFYMMRTAKKYVKGVGCLNRNCECGYWLYNTVLLNSKIVSNETAFMITSDIFN